MKKCGLSGSILGEIQQLTMRFEFGDVVLVPFPFTNQVTSKKRPAVVISSRLYGVSRPDIVVMAITSQIRTTATSLGFGDTDLPDWQQANLLKPSAVKPVLATIEQSLVIKQLGRLSTHDQTALKQTISALIG